MSNDDQRKLDGHRASVREHIEKYKRYPDAYDKDFALKTIRRVQGEISEIKRKHTHWPDSPEDSWRP